MIRVSCYYLMLALQLTYYGGQVCPLINQIPFLHFFPWALTPFFFLLLFRQKIVLKLVRSKPLQSQPDQLFVYDYALILFAGLSIGFFCFLILGISFFSGVKILIGFAAAGLLPAIDLSLAWEYKILREADISSQAGRENLTPSYSRSKRFVVLASGVIFFLTCVLCLLVRRDLEQMIPFDQKEVIMPGITRSLMGDVLTVMSTFLVLILILVFSYTRNLRLLFGLQTAVFEPVSRGLFATKVPVVTNDEFAVIAGHTNSMIDKLMEKECMSRGLELARQIQTSLLPQAAPQLHGIEVFGESVFCDETGGDFYDYLVRAGQDGAELVIMIGDVTGHGIGSALFMTSVRAYLRSQLLTIRDPAKAVRRANEMIVEDTNGSGMFITAFVFLYSPTSRRARWVNAGHNPAFYLQGKSDRIETLEGKNIPLGVSATWQFSSVSRFMDPGILLFGTDGIWEAMNGAEEMFGLDRLAEILLENRSATPRQITAEIFEEVRSFSGQVSAKDDQTVVIAQLL